MHFKRVNIAVTISKNYANIDSDTQLTGKY